jgi:serine/threonine protein kinase
MEMVEGITLKELINQYRILNQPIDERFLLNIFHQIISALNYCHRQGVMHRDLKSDNIILRSIDQVIKIIDFGFSRKFSMNENPANLLCGTSSYMAPEVLQNIKYSFPTDVWSTGVIFYELIMLTLPFESSSDVSFFNSVLSGYIPEINRDCDVFLKSIAYSMLKLNPNQRPTFD